MFSSPCYLLFNLLCSVNFALSSSLYLNFKKSDFFLFFLLYSHCSLMVTVVHPAPRAVVYSLYVFRSLCSLCSLSSILLCCSLCFRLLDVPSVLYPAHCSLYRSLCSLLLIALSYIQCALFYYLCSFMLIVVSYAHCTILMSLCSLCSMLLAGLSCLL